MVACSFKNVMDGYYWGSQAFMALIQIKHMVYFGMSCQAYVAYGMYHGGDFNVTRCERSDGYSIKPPMVDFSNFVFKQDLQISLLQVVQSLGLVTENTPLGQGLIDS